ncbi:glycosyltransferase [Desulfogranum mediterraneum]|uniref:glycosyltransferase n=1 Tax=Desulfogranum mediterraneum TaxID=160661 RepID=UPI00041D36C2|nr:glycosyltransferase [Desulfogranum mediterraneum]
MKRILFIVTGLDTGGIEIYLLRFIKYVECSIEVTVLCKSGKTGCLEDDYIKANAKIVPFKIGSCNIQEWHNFYRFLKNGRFDTVCDFTGTFAAIPLTCAKVAGVKRRLSFYRQSKYQFGSSFYKFLYTFFMRKLLVFSSTKILSNSKTALNNFHEGWGGSKKFGVVYNGVPEILINMEQSKCLRRKFLIPEGAVVVGNVGRYAKAKNHERMIGAAAKVCKENSNIYFFFCGRGVANNLTTVINGFEKQIILSENRTDIGTMLGMFDMFLFCSLDEGQPNALIEAMFANLPIVASNIASIKECIPRELHAKLVDPLSVAEIEEKILDYTNNKQAVAVEYDWLNNRFNLEENFSRFLKELVV